MRFALIFILLALTVPQTHAAPGDKITATSKWSDKPATKRLSRSMDLPTVPEGFSLKKRASNLGQIAAIATIGNDVFVADTAQDRVLRLKSRNADGVFETRAEFLIGFSGLDDLAVDEDTLFMSDKNGIWKIDVGNSLVATEIPSLFYRHTILDSDLKTSIAMSTDTDMLIVGHGNEVFGLSTSTGNKHRIENGSWIVRDIAVSPAGSIWASISQNGSSHIIPINRTAKNGAKLSLPGNSKAIDIQFWDTDNFPKNWPEEWASEMIFALDGNQPMLARTQFNFGDISSDFTSFIDGFSEPSRILGRRNYWGVPVALNFLKNGQLIFAEREQGALWVLEKELEPPKKPDAKTDIGTEATTEPLPEKKPVFPELLKGSSIESASGLETDKLLRAPKKEAEDENQ